MFTILFLSHVPNLWAMSYEEEHEIAKEYISWLEARNLIIHNEETLWTLQNLTDRLAEQIDTPLYHYKIYLVDDRSVNAFAIPDGHIFINLGTLLFVKDIDELAAVIGHEMGHCQLRHISEALSFQKKINIAEVVGILAGALLSSKNPEVGTALIYSSLGGSENFRLSYTRIQETEADKFSKEILTKSSINPSCITRFLVRLRTYSSTAETPEYLLTHPYLENRIASLQIEESAPKPEARYWSLTASVLGLLLTEEEVKARIKDLPEPYNRLSLGIAKIRSGFVQEGLTLLEGIDLPQAYAWKGLALYSLGEEEQAIPYLKRYHLSLDASLALADIMEKKGQTEEALKILAPFEQYHPRAAYKTGSLYQKINKTCQAHVAFARYFYYTKNYKSSTYHIDKALACEDKEIGKDVLNEMKDMKDSIKAQAK